MHNDGIDKIKQSLTVNLSDLELTDVEISLLDKGLSFIPTCKSLNVFKIYESQHKLIRNLKIKDYFNNGSVANTTTAFTGPSRWTPPDHQVSQPTLDTVQRIIRRTASVLKQSTVHNNCIRINKSLQNNLTSTDRSALNTLRNNESIIIKPADKGGATVVMKKLSGLHEAYRQLNNVMYWNLMTRPVTALLLNWQNYT